MLLACMPTASSATGLSKECEGLGTREPKFLRPGGGEEPRQPTAFVKSGTAAALAGEFDSQKTSGPSYLAHHLASQCRR